VWANPSFTTMTGYTLAEAVGKNHRELVKSGQHERVFYQQMWETILAGGVWRGELVNRRKDGSLYSEEMTITPVRDRAGAITHFIAIKQDLTVRNRTELALQPDHHDSRPHLFQGPEEPVYSRQRGPRSAIRIPQSRRDDRQDRLRLV